MASIVLTSIGSALGNELLPGLGGRLLGSYGRRIGKWIDAEIGLGGSTSKDGPRLENLSVQDSRYGVGIPVVFGQTRVAGNVIWATDLIETAHESQVSGGKGGVLGLSSGTRTTYTYSVHCAIAIAQSEIGGIQTIWADSKVIYQNGVWNGGVVGSAGFYYGTTTQNADPFMESIIGSGQVPAYRGMAYVVFESLQLKSFGNRLPNLTFEVLPPNADAEPVWLGQMDGGIANVPTSLFNRGLPPLVIEGSSARARRMLIGGYQNPDATATFSVVDLDVTGTTPAVMARANSASFTAGTITDESWALAPDGRFIAFAMYSTGVSPTHHFVIYDIESQQFGDVQSVSLASTDNTKQIAWIDDQHFVIADISGTSRGLRVLCRAGLNVVDLGFFDVWGSGTSTSRVPLYYTQFIPCADGLLYIASNAAPYFSTIYARPIVWRDNALVVGDAMTLSSGHTNAGYSGPMVLLLRTSDSEWTLYSSTVSYMDVMSFEPSATAISVTRPWQRLQNSPNFISTVSSPVVVGNRIVVLQQDYSEHVFKVSEIALQESDFALVTDGVEVAECADSSTDFGTAAIDGARLLVMGLRGDDNDLYQIGILRRRATGDTLDRVVSNLLERAGYSVSDYDVTDLATTAIDGYVVDDVMTASAAIESLQLFEPFDLIENDAQIKAVRRANTSIGNVPESECRATRKPDANPLPAREQTRSQELDLPLEVTVEYLDASRDYEVGSQRARRTATRGARSIVKVDLPIVCSAARAKQIAEAQLFTAWAERDHTRIYLSRRWLGLNPADVIDLGDRLMRVTRIKQTGGLLEAQGDLVPAAAISSAADADTGAVTTLGNIEPAASSLYLMDLPLLRADDDQAGVYMAASGGAGWTGASVWRSADGVNFSQWATFRAAATAGIATTALANGSAFTFDRASTVNVQLLRGTLASCSEADLLNGANAALLGNEIIQFQTATLAGSGLYTLSHLLRGRRGTESATGSHAIGERFVLLTESSMQFLPALMTDRNRAYSFRVLSDGQSLGDAMNASFTYALSTLKPLSPTHIAGSRSGGTGSDLTLSWKRRARLNADWVDYIDVPLDETTELYDVEIMNGSTVARTYSGVTSTTQTYTAAEQTADWGGSVPAQFTVNVYQLSARYGRGQAGTATV